MEKVAYLRIFGIPEIDNVNRARYKLLKCKIIEDTTCDGEILNWLLNKNLDSLLLVGTTLTNMIMCKIDTSNLNKDNVADMFSKMYKDCEELRKFFESLGDYDMSRQVGYSLATAVTYTEGIEALILSKDM